MPLDKVWIPKCAMSAEQVLKNCKWEMFTLQFLLGKYKTKAIYTKLSLL